MVSDGTIVVTGAGGLVGRSVCATLSAQGIATLPVVRRHFPGLQQPPLIFDLTRDKDLVAKVVGPVSGVVHLAAAVPHSPAYPDTEASASLTRHIDALVLDAVRQWSCPVVYMSTCGLYDRSTPTVKREADAEQIKLDSPYFSAKFDGEKMFGADAKAVILRLAAPIGPGLKAVLVVSRFMEMARRGEVLEVWGSGAREQDFIDVRDVSRLVLAAVLNPRESTYNVASGVPTTMRELACTIVKVVGSGSVEFGGFDDPRDGDTARYSIDLVRETYAWVPKVSLEDSLQAIVDVDFE